MNEVAPELATIHHHNDRRLPVKLEFVSASSSDIGATDGQDKLASSDKKVHWNCKYVQLLLDCVEARMHEFKNKSIHKKVWDDIGKQMQIYGFSTEHCYNKWKNLRRDVRMFAINPNKATKNQDTLNRVKKLISTICPNFDPTAVYKKANKGVHKLSEESSNSLEPLTKLLTPPTSPFSDLLTPVNNENMELDDGGGGEGKLCGGGGGDVYSYLLHGGGGNDNAIVQQTQRQQLVLQPNLFLATAATGNDKDGLGDASKPPSAAATAHTVQCLHNQNNSKPVLLDEPNNNNSASAATAAAPSNYSTWPYELYELLVSFRTEELKQAHSIDQLIRQINEIRDSSVRRMNTIQQLMNLANLLINSKIS